MSQDQNANRTVKLNGEMMRSLRRRHGMSRERLALLSMGGAHHLSESTVKRAEAGKDVFLESARRIASLLEVPLATLALGGFSENEVGIALGVLPFEKLGSDDALSVLTEGLYRDLTTRLSQNWFPVTSVRAMTNVGRSRPITEVMASVDVDYVLDGSIQAADTSYRASVRLVRRDGSSVFGWTRDISRGNVLQIQTELLTELVGQLQMGLTGAELRRLCATPKTDLDAWGLAVKGQQLFYVGSREANSAARVLLAEAVAKEKALTTPAYLLAATFQQDLVNGWAPPMNALAGYKGAVDELISRDPGGAHSLLGSAYLAIYRGDRVAAVDHCQAALETSPSLDRAYILMGQLLSMMGETDRALEQLEVAHRLCPIGDDGSVLLAEALAYFVAERYTESVDAARGALRSGCPTRPLACLTEIASLQLADRPEEAQQRARHLPDGAALSLGLIASSTQPEIAQRFAAALARSGVPVGK